MARCPKTDLVTITVLDEVPDLLQRIALLNGALFRVLSGVRLIKVLEADYREGRVQAVVESRRTRPPVVGRVSVRYQPQS